MRKRSGNQKAQSLKKVSLGILITAGIMVVCLLACMFWGIRENKKLGSDYIRDTAELYIEQINSDIRQINSELVYLRRQYADIDSFPDEMRPQDAVYYELLENIREQNRILKIRYSEVDCFFVYAQKAGVLITDTGTVFSTSLKSTRNQVLMELLKSRENEESQSTRWELLDTGEEICIVSRYTKKGKTMGCVIELETIFETLQKAMQNYDAIPFIRLAEDELILPGNCSEKYAEKIRAGIDESDLLTYPLGSIGQIQLYVVPGSGLQEQLLYYQVFFAGLIVTAILTLAVLAYAYYEKIMAPMQSFVHALDDVDEEQLLNEDGTNNILELEFASEKFRTLLRRLQSLRIALYEKELAKQQAELEYVQEQVRPHFLLNCLSVIHGMADEKGDKEILEITEVLSEYMRYVMKDSRNQRLIREELEHIASYVRMQKLRYGEEAFSYEVILDGDVENALVPPLLLQTLVENSIVHEVSLDRKIEISLYITQESHEDGMHLYISVSDTGDGFTEEMLQALEEDLPIVYNGRKHVGLQNIRRRLALMYGDRAGISFSNMGEHYGAVVEVHLPLENKKS